MRKAEAFSRNGNTISIRGPEGKSHSKREFLKVCQAVSGLEVKKALVIRSISIQMHLRRGRLSII